jgi:hypothetical protein
MNNPASNGLKGLALGLVTIGFGRAEEMRKLSP